MDTKNLSIWNSMLIAPVINYVITFFRICPPIRCGGFFASKAAEPSADPPFILMADRNLSHLIRTGHLVLPFCFQRIRYT
jgi:hypothetical protein